MIEDLRVRFTRDLRAARPSDAPIERLSPKPFMGSVLAATLKGR